MASSWDDLGRFSDYHLNGSRYGNRQIRSLGAAGNLASSWKGSAG